MERGATGAKSPENGPPENDVKNDAEKALKNHAKMSKMVMPEGCRNLSRNQFFIDSVILRKACFYYNKSMVLEVPGVPKSMKMHAKTMRNKLRKSDSTSV